VTPRPVHLLLSSIAALALLSGCVAPLGPATPAPAPDEVAAASATADMGVPELAALPVHELVHLLESAPLDARPEVMASVRPREVLLADVDGARQASVPVPAGEFYLSIAPYREHTHECYFHSLTTCTGELGETPVQIRIVDTTTGQVLVDETRTTYANGYVDVWLPTDITADVTIMADGRTGTARIRTGPDDLTCLTSLQLI
jgi:hypothetical protein